MTTVKTCVITGFGINADYELVEAFRLSGSEAKLIHITDIIAQPSILKAYHILAFPGGFSYGDHIGSGKVFGSLFKKNLKKTLDEFLSSNKLVIGICNGFQTLVKMGILPNLAQNWKQEVSLIHNDSGKFEDRWVYLKANKNSPCVWTKGIESLELPVRHGEGKFIVENQQIQDTLVNENLIAFTYAVKNGEPVSYPANPNGSILDIAGICDRSGRILGLMPHPEAFLIPQNHPRWTRENITEAPTLNIFKRGVEFIQANV